MNDAFLNLADGLMSSPWLYLALFAIAALDGFLPVVPSETLVITAGVFAAHGDPSLSGVIAAAAAGAFVGDHTSYLLGRRAGARRLRRLRPGSRRHAAFLGVSRALAERGGLVLVVARYIPGGRTAVTLTMGALGYPLRSFTFFAALAAGSWAVYCSLVGFVGGAAFEEEPIKGVLLGIGLALTVTVVVELVRLRNRRAVATALAAERHLTSPQPYEGAMHR